MNLNTRQPDLSVLTDQVHKPRNLSAACAIILSEAQRQRKLAGMYDDRRLPEDEYNRLLFRW